MEDLDSSSSLEDKLLQGKFLQASRENRMEPVHQANQANPQMPRLRMVSRNRSNEKQRHPNHPINESLMRNRMIKG